MKNLDENEMETLLSNFSIFFNNKLYSQIQREDIIDFGDIEKADSYLTELDKIHLRRQIMNFFQNAKVPSYFSCRELLVYYRYNPRFREIINKEYTNESLRELNDKFDNWFANDEDDADVSSERVSGWSEGSMKVEQNSDFDYYSEENFQMAAASTNPIDIIMPEQTDVVLVDGQPPVYFDGVLIITFFDSEISDFIVEFIDREKKFKEKEARSEAVALRGENIYQITLDIDIESILGHKYRIKRK